MFKSLMGSVSKIWEDITSEKTSSTLNTEESFEALTGESKHIFVVGALGAGKSTAMSVLFDPTEAATE